MRATPLSTLLAALGLVLALLVCAETAHGQGHTMTQRDYTRLTGHSMAAP